MTKSILLLEKAVKNAEDELIMAQNKLFIAKQELASAFENSNNSSNDIFELWKVWSNQKTYNNIVNVIAYFEPGPSWHSLKDFINKKNNINSYDGGSWYWTQELAPHIDIYNKTFINLPFSETKIINALKAIMEYNSNYYEEFSTTDL